MGGDCVRPLSPVVDGRVVGSTWHGMRPIGVTTYLAAPRTLTVLCRSCRNVISTCEPSVASAVDTGCRHLRDVDHSPAAVAS